MIYFIDEIFKRKEIHTQQHIIFTQIWKENQLVKI